MTKKNKPIALIGFMGSGKSSIGPMLAQKLNYRFVDTDTLIEEKAGQKISAIFANQGEKAFREMETAVLKELSKDTSLVIATGGGIVLKEENRDLLENSTFLVSLMASPEIIYERTRTDNNRPLLQDPNPLLKIETMLSDRKAFYEIGNLKINTDSDSLETICEIIFESYLKQ
ncbi:MAG: shikimate kinase [Eubacteriaceae bacterium]|jgi:shikimate kinase|nr:shikimate kinase [Eubacteriaceae bacterium]